MDWANLWRAGFAAACAGWFLTALVALRSRRLLRAHLAARRASDDQGDDTLRMLRVDALADDSGGADGDTVVSDATELLARIRGHR